MMITLIRGICLVCLFRFSRAQGQGFALGYMVDTGNGADEVFKNSKSYLPRQWPKGVRHHSSYTVKSKTASGKSASYNNPTVMVNADFDVLYNGTVKDGIKYTYKFEEPLNKSWTARVYVFAPNATRSFPVQFVVREPETVISWPVPLFLQNRYDYYNVSRTLCPTEDFHQNKTDLQLIQPTRRPIRVDVSCMSPHPVHFSILAYRIFFDIKVGMKKAVEISASEPAYFRFTFPIGITSVIVKAESNDSLCMVFSIQDPQCPVSDLIRNVELSGMYQTVTKKGAITVTRDYFKDNMESKFFVVLVLRPDDLQCSKMATEVIARRKKVVLQVSESVQDMHVIYAVVGAVGWFLFFYLVSFIVGLVHCIRLRCNRNRVLDRIPQQVSDSEDSRLLDSSPVPTTRGLHNYGATEGPAEPRGQTPGADTDPQSTTRQSPSETSSINENEYDFMKDIDEEKDVFRTKMYLYVADTARKPRKMLSKKFRMYYWNLVTIAIFYGLPVIQLVVTYQTVVNRYGDQDVCYYNFYCANPLGVLSSFNNVFSNIGYILLGLLFLLIVWRRDVIHKRQIAENDWLEKTHGIPQHFGLFYSMGIGLMMEGILSACYHVCPNYSNYQFDTSFMYMTAWLCMLKIYQIRHPDINPHAYIAYFALAMVILIAVVGVLYGIWLFWVVYAVLHILCTLVLSINIYYIGRCKLNCGAFKRLYLLLRADRLYCAKPIYPIRMVLLLVGNAVNWTFAIYGLITRPGDFPTYLVAIFMVNLLMYFAFYIIMKLRSKEKIYALPLMYIIIATIVWGAAGYFFFAKLTSWEQTASKSREGNKDCMLLNFYDAHDIWHFLSAMSMFFSFMILLTLDDDLIEVPRNQIPVF